MMEETKEKWIEKNQSYLLASFKVIRLELEHYQAGLQGKDSSETEEQTLAAARGEVQTIVSDMATPPAIESLTDLFGLSAFEKAFLLLCAGMELDAKLAERVHQVQGKSTQRGVTFGLALSALSGGHWSALSPDKPLRFWRLVELDPKPYLTNAGCSIDEHILHYLLGVRGLDHRLHDFLKPVDASGPLAPSQKELSEKLRRLMPGFGQKGVFPIIQVLGGSPEDSLAIIARAFAPFNVVTYQLILSLIPSNFKELCDLLLYWNRTASLNNYAIHLTGDEWQYLDQSVKDQVIYFLNNLQGVVVFFGKFNRASLKRAVHELDAPQPLVSEQTVLWKQALGEMDGQMDALLEELAMQFRLDSHAIHKLGLMAMATQSTNGVDEKYAGELKDRLWKICCEHTRPDLEQLGQRIDPRASWDDLVLPAPQKSLLKEIVIQVQHRQKVYEEWGFAKKSNRGLGITALFSGVSGTGKTMASEVLANALQLDLYRIDLSQVVNKYIGETEKNLKKIFDAAEGSGAILLFDEADALFGKRSEVKDSHDRYSNIEVSYLLQKMEEYRGLAILTTNMRKALDKAFLRRLRFVVTFPFPDANIRAEIWKRIFPDQTPIRGLDIQKLAVLNVAGGNIRNIAMNASFLAADRNEPVSMNDIHQAARNEYLKLEKQMSSSESLI